MSITIVYIIIFFIMIWAIKEFIFKGDWLCKLKFSYALMSLIGIAIIIAILIVLVLKCYGYELKSNGSPIIWW